MESGQKVWLLKFIGTQGRVLAPNVSMVAVKTALFLLIQYVCGCVCVFACECSEKDEEREF